MYELVNTSVPNGLVAGTHGFATVAMTKGMPDAIRTRVENFCAYPHRTSAHDATYLQENPINWFHLILPTGDHVIGRTAPCEFDYTGRTNRLSHVLVLKGGEVPAAGAVAALNLEASRFSEAWSGEPRYLPEDKGLGRRFFSLTKPTGGTPSNWTALLGPEGASFAKRFARLLEQNMLQGNRGIYFKVSIGWDNSGTKLLGLFSDLLNLLPENIATQVTFSTFAPCVPSGAACHLRGIFDKDRAFEVASTTQPWVDCEKGCVVHAELLPDESAPAAATGHTEATKTTAKDAGNPSQLKLSRAAALAGAGGRVGGQSGDKGGSSALKWIVVIGAIAFMGIGAGVKIWYDNNEALRRQKDKILLEAKEEEARKASEAAAEAERVAREKRDAEEREKLEKEEKRKAQEQAKKDEIKRQEAAQIANDKAKKEAEAAVAQAKKQQEAEAEARRKQESQEALKKRAAHGDPFADLAITKVLAADVAIDSENGIGIDPKVLRGLTNQTSIVVYHPEGGKVVCEFSHYECSVKKVAKTGGRKENESRYSLKSLDSLASTPWCVWVYTNAVKQSQEVIWQWRRFERRRLFTQSKEAELDKLGFYGIGAAYKLWQRSRPNAFFVVKMLDLAQDREGANQVRFVYALEVNSPKITMSSFEGVKNCSVKTDPIDKLENDLKKLPNPEVITNKINQLVKWKNSYYECREKEKNANSAKDKDGYKGCKENAEKQFKDIVSSVAGILHRDEKPESVTVNKCEEYCKRMRDIAKNAETERKKIQEEIKKHKKSNDDNHQKLENQIKNSIYEISVEEKLPRDLQKGLNCIKE